jgi:hypothetical protein
MTALTFAQALRKYRPDQARDDKGRFVHEGGSSRRSGGERRPKKQPKKQPRGEFTSQSAADDVTAKLQDVLQRMDEAQHAASELGTRLAATIDLEAARRAAHAEYHRGIKGLVEEANGHIDRLVKLPPDASKYVARGINALRESSRRAQITALRREINGRTLQHMRIITAGLVPPW